jgi:hypothetical protein
MKTNGIDQKIVTKIHTCTAIWLLTKEHKICIGEKIDSSTNNDGKSVNPPVED